MWTENINSWWFFIWINSIFLVFKIVIVVSFIKLSLTKHFASNWSGYLLVIFMHDLQFSDWTFVFFPLVNVFFRRIQLIFNSAAWWSSALWFVLNVRSITFYTDSKNLRESSNFQISTASPRILAKVHRCYTSLLQVPPDLRWSCSTPTSSPY